MTEASDMDLVREYAAHNSEVAFAELVRRHIHLVYSVALRYAGNPHDAEDVTQAVFIILARKAAGLGNKSVLTGWLYETARFTGMQFLRTKVRRQIREQEAHVQSTVNDPEPVATWRQIAPLLEEAMTRLGEKERALLALRFFENRGVSETAALLGIGEWAARKRTDRAVKKLRTFFARRGVPIAAATLIGAITANSVQAAPTALANSVATVAMAKGATVGSSTVSLIQGALKIMAWAKAKIAIVSGAGILLALGVGSALILQNTESLAASDILAKTRDAYATLSNYTDSGESSSSTYIAASPNEVLATTTNRFVLKLARPGLSLVEWEGVPPDVTKGAVWSTAASNYVWLTSLTTVPNTNALVFRRSTNFSVAPNLPEALISAIATSSRASTALPSTFFNQDRMARFNLLRTNLPAKYARKPDEKIRGIDCYVLSITPTAEAPPTSTYVQRTLWIGKEDFLVHRSQETTEFQQNVPLKTDTEIAATLQRMNGNRLSPALLATLVTDQQRSEAALRRPRRNTITQTHNDIRVNQPLTENDFIPQLPAGLGPPKPLDL